MRGSRGLLVLMAVAAAACGPGEAATTTLGTTTTTTSPPTSTTTTTLPETTTTVVAVEGVPEEALALIGAPMPAVPEYPDGFDAEVWFEAYAAWNQWAFANPVEGLESLDLWVVPGSEYSESLREQLERSVDEGWRTVAMGDRSMTFETGDELLDEGTAAVFMRTEGSSELWVIDAQGAVVAAESVASDARVEVVLTEESGTWFVSSWLSLG